jgi:cobalt-precorrin 5A hydrolase / precorrin-3B C17-methyltransferase
MSAAEVVIVALTRAGTRLAGRLAPAIDATVAAPARFASALEDAEPFSDSALAEVGRRWPEARALVLVMATGIAVRAIAPLLGRKSSDPAVVCLDEAGRFAIPLLGGHQAGANALAERVAGLVGGQAIVTTASDAQGLPALDQLGKAEGWKIDPVSALTHTMACLVNGDPIGLFVDPALVGAREQLDDWLAGCASVVTVTKIEQLQEESFAAAIVVSQRRLAWIWPALALKGLRYLPPALVAGMGCRRGVPLDELRAALDATLADADLELACLAALATADLKADEPGLHELAAALGLPLTVVGRDQLDELDINNFSPSAARERFDLPGVAEPCALAASGGGALIVPKRAFARCTVAVALRGSAPERQEAAATAGRAGKLTLIGIGPGDMRQLTIAAREALQAAEVVTGYQVYIDQVRALLAPQQELIVTPAMGDEVGRARQAIALASQGRRVAMISSGDIGIYAMAGPVFEQLRDAGWQGQAPEVEVLPGISAVQAAAARLGAPISHDFCLVSLSDLLTPWEQIERRLQAAAEGDFVVALYNPRSRQRHWQLERALAILRAQRSAETPVAVVRNVTRPDEAIALTTIAEIDITIVDMFTLVLIGSRSSYVVAGHMATPRGYAAKAQNGGSHSPAGPESTGLAPQGRQAGGEDEEHGYPITLTGLAGNLAIVVGGGPIGERKARGLLATGVAVRLISPEASERLRELAEAGRIAWEPRPYAPGDLAGARLVFAATNLRAVNAAVAAEAAALGVLCNVADDPQGGSFHLPAVHRAQGLTVAVSTGGADPRRAAAARDAIARWLASAEVAGAEGAGRHER